MAKEARKPDFSGYATKAGVRCSDGRTITKDAFAESNGQNVPLVWQHMHNDPKNILGYATLEHRQDGVYAQCFLNETESATLAGQLIKHGDITSLSIYANSLVEKGKMVLHGVIRELSLVLAGANEGAKIDYIAFEHSCGDVVESDSEALIYSGMDLEMPSSSEEPLPEETPPSDTPKPEEPLKHAASKDSEAKKDEDDETVQDVFDSMSDKQKTVVYAMLDEALTAAEKDNGVAHADKNKEKGDQKDMKNNVFDNTLNKAEPQYKRMKHSDIAMVFADAVKMGSLRNAMLQHGATLTATYGIENIDFLFPDPKNVTNTPTMIKRDTTWVKDVFGAAHHTPFSRIKTIHADLTNEEARAKGYVKANEKVDEVIALLKRTTIPTTIYKKQKLDRDDVIDITDMDVVSWLKSEMRMMLDEELARAMLVGDGRSPADNDKIKADSIRPIYLDDDLYSVKVPLAFTDTTMQIMDGIVRARKDYKGSGNPVFFSTPDIICDMLLLTDTTGRRLYNTINDVAAALRVSKIVEVPVMDGLKRTDEDGDLMNLIGIVVNMTDYYLGADKGGQVSMFDDFDIDFNQYKYLIETRCSGALVVPHSALVIEQAATDPNPGP